MSFVKEKDASGKTVIAAAAAAAPHAAAAAPGACPECGKTNRTGAAFRAGWKSRLG